MANGIRGWVEAGFEVTQSNVISVAELKRTLDAQEHLLLLDVRRSGEYDAGHVAQAINIPLAELAGRIPEIQTSMPLAVICASGYRSSIAGSVLERSGVSSVINVLGGTAAWKHAGNEVKQREVAKA